MAGVISGIPSPSSGEWDLAYVADAAPTNVHRLLTSSNWVGKTGELVIKVIQSQLDAYYHNLERYTIATPALTTLFDAAAYKIATLLGEDPENLNPILEAVNPAIARAAWSWPSIPYPALCSIWRRVFRDNVVDIKTKDEVVGYILDVDNWIIKNEDWLRQHLHIPQQDWRIGLVTLENCDDLFFSSKSFPSSRRITRSKVDGWKCLDAKRTEAISIQPNIKLFKERFEEMTFGQLKGLDWSNIFVAGGIIVGSMLCTADSSPEKIKEQWRGSDIDIYIYGLNPIQANEKIDHLFTVFKHNLPESAPILVVRNSKTITFISSFPRRRFQVILKIVKNPAEILLNFDLDICAMGFDGEHAYMLPRASRALETGYNVFTMDMVQGHYLGTRRATQEERIYKYAYKGYGIRILPQYLEALKKFEQSYTERDIKAVSSPEDLDFEHKMAKARRYFDAFMKTLIESNRRWNSTYKPSVSHASLNDANETSREPLRRSCLTGFEWFYRHICLWEAEQDGKIEIGEDGLASTTYEDDRWGSSYNELPFYQWDESFEIKEFEERISTYNSAYQRTIEKTFWEASVDDCVEDKLVTRKIISGSSLMEVMQEDICIPVWIPQEFLTFASDMIEKISNDMPDLPFNECFEELWTLQKGRKEPETLVLVNFHLSPVTAFAQIDRRLDEILESIWCFMHSNVLMIKFDSERRTTLLKTQLSRRSPRTKSEDEYKDFAAWVGRSPGDIAYSSNFSREDERFWRQVEAYIEKGDT
ncbi:hypothetical protein CPB86DRAFT_784896 [Serendipita vermifera]|nr:hypothetical protein CPB86DRAFT_784896 [Serendipita vermifera]